MSISGGGQDDPPVAFVTASRNASLPRARVSKAALLEGLLVEVVRRDGRSLVVL
jgi:hypothetical protein